MRISHIPVIGAKVPFSLYSTHSTHNVARTAALQAINGHDVTVYGSDDSTVIAEAAALAEKNGKTVNRSENSFRIKNGGSLTLRSIKRTLLPDRTSTPAAAFADKPLYDLVIADEKKHPSDVVAIHTIWYSGYLKNAGLSNVLLHVHMNAQPFSQIKGEWLEVAQALQCDIRNGQLVPSQPTIALTKASAQGWRDAGGDVIGFVNHGIDMPPAEEVKDHSSGYLLSLGRLSPEKNVVDAIKVAKQSGKPLIIAGTIAVEGDQHIVAAMADYYHDEIKPYITEFADRLSLDELKGRIQQLDEHKGSYGNNPPIIFVGKALGEKKSYLYQNAAATLFLAEPEAFGLPQIESLAYGTPVISYSTDNIIDNGITGFQVQSTTEAAEAVSRIDGMDRHKARHWFENRFNVKDEVQEIEWIYNRVFIKKFLDDFQSPETGELKAPETEKDKERFRIFAQICRDSHLISPFFTTTRIHRAYTHQIRRIQEITAGLQTNSAQVFLEMNDMDRNAIIHAAVNGHEFEEDASIEERIKALVHQVRDPIVMESVLDTYKEYLSNESRAGSRSISSLSIHRGTGGETLDGSILDAREEARETQEPQILWFNDDYLVVHADSDPDELINDYHAAEKRRFEAFRKSPESLLARMICAELPQAVAEGEQAVVEWIGKLAGLRGDFKSHELAETLILGGYEYGYPLDAPETETDPSEYAKWLIGRVVEWLWEGAPIYNLASEWVDRYQELMQNTKAPDRSWVAAVRKEPQENQTHSKRAL